MSQMMTAASALEQESIEGWIAPVLPLALLEAVQAHDRPGEVLEEDDPMLSLPGRLGLTGVVFTQIRRYEAAVRENRRVPLGEVVSLLALVQRRPDAEAVFRDTGERITRGRVHPPRPLARRALTVLPNALRSISLRRATRRLLRGLGGEGEIEVASRLRGLRADPLIVRLTRSPTARAGEAACTVFTGALDELIRVYGGPDNPVTHDRCRARGEEVCEWRVTR